MNEQAWLTWSGQNSQVDRNQRGRNAEARALEFVRQQGWTIVTQNFRVPGGEIDLIALDGEVLVFVEVRSRKDGHAIESIGPKKVEALIRAANVFREQNESEGDYRFDLITVCNGVCEHYADFIQ